MKRLFFCLAFLLLIGFGCNRPKTTTEKADLNGLPSAKDGTVQVETITIYVGKGCPHCELIESRVKDTGMDKKLPITFKESFDDAQNAAELIQVAKKCNRSIDSAGVPLLWTGRTCYFGDANILRYLEDRMKPFANEPK